MVLVKVDGSEREIEILLVRSSVNEEEAVEVTRMFADGIETSDPVEATEIEIEGVRLDVQPGDLLTVRVNIL